MNSTLKDVRYYKPDKRGKFEVFRDVFKGFNKWVWLGLGRSEASEPLDVIILAPGDVEGCRRAIYDVLKATMAVFNSPSDGPKLAASRNEYGQSSQAVHGSQVLVKMAAVYLIFQREQLAKKFNETGFNVAFRSFNNKVRGLYTEVEIPEGDLRSFSGDEAEGYDEEEGGVLLQNACVAAGTALYGRALSRSIITTLETEFPAEVKPFTVPTHVCCEYSLVLCILCSLSILFSFKFKCCTSYYS